MSGYVTAEADVFIKSSSLPDEPSVGDSPLTLLVSTALNMRSIQIVSCWTTALLAMMLCSQVLRCVITYATAGALLDTRSNQLQALTNSLRFQT